MAQPISPTKEVVTYYKWVSWLTRGRDIYGVISLPHPATSDDIQALSICHTAKVTAIGYDTNGELIGFETDRVRYVRRQRTPTTERTND